MAVDATEENLGAAARRWLLRNCRRGWSALHRLSQRFERRRRRFGGGERKDDLGVRLPRPLQECLRGRCRTRTVRDASGHRGSPGDGQWNRTDPLAREENWKACVV